jgi:hypothetical protein
VGGSNLNASVADAIRSIIVIPFFRFPEEYIEVIIRIDDITMK